MSLATSRGTRPEGNTVFGAMVCPAPASMLYAQTSCKLFSLPPELRNAIYTYALRPDPYSTYRASESAIEFATRKMVAPSNVPLLACRRIRDEANGIFIDQQRSFWRDNTFSIDMSQKHEVAYSIGGYHIEFPTPRLNDDQLNLIQKFVVFARNNRDFRELHSVERACSCGARYWFVDLQVSSFSRFITSPSLWQRFEWALKNATRQFHPYAPLTDEVHVRHRHEMPLTDLFRLERLQFWEILDTCRDFEYRR